MTGKRSFRKRMIDRAADLFRIAVLCGTAPFPFAVRSAVGGWFGRVLLTMLPGVVRRMETGLGIAFPEMPDKDRAALIRRSARMSGRTQVEIFLSRELEKLVPGFAIEGPGLDAIRAAAAMGKGAVLVSGHFGQWEAVRLFLKSQGLETAAIYREFTNPHYEAAFRKAFEYNGAPVFKRGRRGTLEMVRHLRGGGRIAILTDQAEKRAPLLPMFGKPAHSSLAAAELALKYDLPLVPVYGIRGDDPMHFTVRFEAPLAHSDATTMTRAINDSLEAMVRAHPEQWFWIHRRWRLSKTAVTSRT